MKVIKRKICLEKSTDRASKNLLKWGTLTASTFYINVLLTQNIDDMGLFNDIERIPYDKNFNTPPDYTLLIDKLTDLGLTFPFMNPNIQTPYFNTISTPKYMWNILSFPQKEIDYYYNYVNKVITGYTQSRLEDIRSYDTLMPFKVGFDMNRETYLNYLNNTINGVDRLIMDGEPKKYVFDANDDNNIGTINQNSGLYFEDYSTTRAVTIDEDSTSINLTLFRYIGEGLNETNTSLSAITKEEYLFGIISPPEVQDDVFIDRGINTVLEKHLRLSEIRNLNGLEKYGNGFYKLNKT